MSSVVVYHSKSRHRRGAHADRQPGPHGGPLRRIGYASVVVSTANSCLSTRRVRHVE